MNKDEIKSRIDFNNIQEIEIQMIEGIPDTIEKIDCLIDFEGNAIIQLTPLVVKLIEKIKELDERIKILEVK